MRKWSILAAFLWTMLFGRSAYSQDLWMHAANEQKYLSLKPDLEKLSRPYNTANIPFIVKNVSNEEILITETWNRIDALMTLDDSGKKVSVEDYLHPNRGHDFGGPMPRRVILKPGESTTYDCVQDPNTLISVASKNKQVFGAVSARILRTGQWFISYSDPFSVPDEFATHPWQDLGEQNYFTVTPNLTESRIDKVNQLIIFPVKITNTTNQIYVVTTDRVSFYILSDDGKRYGPSPYESIKPNNPVLKPGESVMASGRSYIMFTSLRSHGHKPGDKIVAAAGGRVPDTNKIFECYSEPFVLPPLPDSPAETLPFPTPHRKEPIPPQVGGF